MNIKQSVLVSVNLNGASEKRRNYENECVQCKLHCYICIIEQEQANIKKYVKGRG